MTSILKVDQIQNTAGGVPTAGDLGLNVSGSLLQVVEGSTITQVEGSYSSATSLGLSASITPLSTSSKILILVNLTGCGSRDTGTLWRGILRRDTTDLCTFNNYTGSQFNSGSETYVNGTYYDSPNTSSSVTYAMYGERMSGSNNCYAIHNNSANPRQRATITLMEIAG